MTTPDRSTLGDAAEADVAEQHRPVGAVDEESWQDTVPGVGADRDWQADEADVIEQAIAVSDDDAEYDR